MFVFDNILFICKVYFCDHTCNNITIYFMFQKLCLSEKKLLNQRICFSMDVESQLVSYFKSLKSKHILSDVVSSLCLNHFDPNDQHQKIEILDCMINKLTDELISHSSPPQTSQQKPYKTREEIRELLCIGYLRKKANKYIPTDINYIINTYFGDGLMTLSVPKYRFNTYKSDSRVYEPAHGLSIKLHWSGNPKYVTLQQTEFPKNVARIFTLLSVKIYANDGMNEDLICDYKLIQTLFDSTSNQKGYIRYFPVEKSKLNNLESITIECYMDILSIIYNKKFYKYSTYNPKYRWPVMKRNERLLSLIPLIPSYHLCKTHCHWRISDKILYETAMQRKYAVGQICQSHHTGPIIGDGEFDDCFRLSMFSLYSCFYIEIELLRIPKWILDAHSYHRHYHSFRPKDEIISMDIQCNANLNGIEDIKRGRTNIFMEKYNNTWTKCCAKFEKETIFKVSMLESVHLETLNELWFDVSIDVVVLI